MAIKKIKAQKKKKLAVKARKKTARKKVQKKKSKKQAAHDPRSTCSHYIGCNCYACEAAKWHDPYARQINRRRNNF